MGFWSQISLKGVCTERMEAALQVCLPLHAAGMACMLTAPRRGLRYLLTASEESRAADHTFTLPTLYLGKPDMLQGHVN